MDEGIRETVGFLCRWCLLALAGVTAMAVCWAALLATAAMTAGLGADVVPSDTVCGQSAEKPAALRCYQSPVVSHSNNPHAMGVLPDGALATAYTYRGGFYLRADRSTAGRYSIRTKGLPYSALAFHNRRLRLKVLPPGRRVFLVDAELAVAVRPSQRRSLRQCLDHMRRLGDVAFFHAGDRGELLLVRDILGRKHPDTPVLAAYHGNRPPAPLSVPRMAAWDLNPPTGSGRRLSDGARGQQREAAVQSGDGPHIRFLGTGAADWRPPHECNDACAERCARIERLGGPNIRRASALFIAPDTLIDFTGQTAEALDAFDIDGRAVRSLAIAHGHQDHFQPIDILAFAAGLPHTLALYGNATVAAAMEFAGGHQWDAAQERFVAAGTAPNVRTTAVAPGITFAVGHARVTAVLANHMVDRERMILEQQALNFIVEIGYATDQDGTGFWEDGPEATIAGDGSTTAFVCIADTASFTVAQDEYLAVRITNQGSSSYLVRAGGAWSHVSASVDDLEADVEIPLVPGYNAVSWNVAPENDSVAVIFGDLLATGKVSILLDYKNDGAGVESFDFYIPALGPSNPFQRTESGKGYFVQLNPGVEPETLRVRGPYLDPQMELPLVQGYNLVAYLPDGPDSLVHALDSMGFDKMSIALDYQNDGAGVESFDFYIPALGPSNPFQVMEPGKGYFIQLNPGETDMLIYPETQVPIAEVQP